MATTTVKGNGKLAVEEFITTAIKALRADNKPDAKGRVSKGIHSVYSGFNRAFKDYYGADSNPVTTVTALVEKGTIQTHFAKGGVMMYLHGEMPERSSGPALDKILTAATTKKAA